jgi:cation transport protein ChaC
VRQGSASREPIPDYVRSTHAHLIEMGVPDPVLADLAAALDAA